MILQLKIRLSLTDWKLLCHDEGGPEESGDVCVGAEPIPIKACASQLCGAKTPGICRTDCWKISRADLRVGYSSVQQQRHRCGCKCLGRTSLPPTLPPYPPTFSQLEIKGATIFRLYQPCCLWALGIYWSLTLQKDFLELETWNSMHYRLSNENKEIKCF